MAVPEGRSDGRDVGGRWRGAGRDVPVSRGLVTMSEGTEAAPCPVLKLRRDEVRCRDTSPVRCAGVSPSDTAPWDTQSICVAPCGVSPGDSARAEAGAGGAAVVKPEVEGDGEAAFLKASVAEGMSGRVSPTVFAGVGDDGSSAPSRSRFLAEYAGGTGMHGGGGGVEELGQRLLEDSDAGIDGGKCTVGDRA